jgi:hypothetical protein
VLSAQVDKVAREILASDGNDDSLLRELARRVAEAEVDVLRVRRARQDLIVGAMSNPAYQSPATPQDHLACHVHTAEEVGVDIPVPSPLGEGAAPKAPKNRHAKMAIVLFDLGERLALLDRYERRALSRRKFAIRDFDKLRVKRTKTTAARPLAEHVGHREVRDQKAERPGAVREDNAALPVVARSARRSVWQHRDPDNKQRRRSLPLLARLRPNPPPVRTASGFAFWPNEANRAKGVEVLAAPQERNFS